MNEQARQILIERAILNAPIAYSTFLQQLGFDTYNPSILYSTLEDISRFEKENGRPALTVMAKYLDKDEWGNGFYELSNELEYPRPGEKLNRFFAKRMQKECHEYWMREKTNRSKIKSSFQIPFFKKSEIDVLYDWQYKVYDMTDETHVATKDFLLKTVWAKTAYWAEELGRRLPEYDIINRRMWSQPGWDDGPNGKIQVSRFKKYTWARIFKKGDGKKDIFFTIGVDANSKSLLYKLDYFFETDSSLNEAQKSLCVQLIPDELKWLPIPYDEIENHSWDSLLKITSQFISENTFVYDKIIEAVWQNKVPVNILRDKLILRNKPLIGLDRLPDLNPAFNGFDKDYLAEHAERIITGTAGEDLVIDYERRCLLSKGLPELADKVEKRRDGFGYDIISFDENGGEKHIEVKTTVGDIYTEFEVSLNEWMYMKKNPLGYYIYRLFNYNKLENVAEFYILDNAKDQLLFQATNFRAYIKK